MTPFERPAAFGEKAVLSDDEVEQIEEQAAASSKQDEGRKRGTAADLGRAYNDFWYDRGTRAASTRQTSIVVDPANGRMPALTPEAQARAERVRRPVSRRTGGRPRGSQPRRALPSRLQRGSAVRAERVQQQHRGDSDPRLRRDRDRDGARRAHRAARGRKHLPSTVRPWMGDSRGRWEGDTLVVETTNFSEKNLYRGATRTSSSSSGSRARPDTLVYEFTVNDPATWTAPWTGRVPLERLDEEVYEYACHEATSGWKAS